MHKLKANTQQTLRSALVENWEYAIQRVRAEQKVSFSAAKKIVQASGSSGSVNTNSKSFAKVVTSGQSSSLQDATTTVEQLNQRVANIESRLALCNSVTGPSGDRSSATKLVSPFSFSAAGPLNKEGPVFIPPFTPTFPSCQSKTDSKNVYVQRWRETSNSGKTWEFAENCIFTGEIFFSG